MLFSGTTFWWDSLWFPMIISHRSERAKVRKMDSELLSPLASDKSSSQRLERDLPVSQMESESIKWQTKTYKGNKAQWFWVCSVRLDPSSIIYLLQFVFLLFNCKHSFYIQISDSLSDITVVNICLCLLLVFSS